MTLKDIQDAYQKLRGRMRLKWHRDLPIWEMLFSRWERATSLGFGKGTSIHHSAHVYGNVKVGEDTWIGPFVILDGSGGLEIGAHCSISAGVQVYTHDSVDNALSGGVAKYPRSPTKIGNNCYIGPNAVIAKGVTIGDHSVVGALSFVGKSVPAWTKVAGCPAKIVGKVERKL